MNKTIHYRHLLLFAAAMALGTSFTACSSDDAATEGTQPTVAANTDAVSFDAYTQRSTTRAGFVGTTTTAELKNTGDDHLGKAGFGVFAYYTDNFDYTPLYQPNFMYNEHVKWDGTASAFKYDVTKYWPNEHGSQAQSADQDRVSFFAYLPYVEVDPSTGMIAENGTILDPSDPKLQWGITGTKRNTLQGDPIIQYIASFDQSKSVDLCWATTGGTDITWSTNGTTQTIKGGYPWLNVRKPSGVADNDARIRFNFQHATAKLTVNVKTDFTGGWTATEPTEPTEPTKTKVWVRSIRFTGIAEKAALNLNNPKTLGTNKARWMDYYGTNELELGESVTIHDGRKDGSEGVADAIAPNEAILGLNPQIVQNEGQINAAGTAWLTTGENMRSGVTTTAVNAFTNNGTAASHVYVIPTGEKVNVEIVYDIETIDSKLPEMLSDGETQGSSVENRITKAVSFGTASKFESGKAYTINLILGMKDVQFTAEVSDDWGDDSESDVYLPSNTPMVSAGGTLNLTVPADATSHPDITITGLQPGKSYTFTPTDPCTDPTGSQTADAQGVLKLTDIMLDDNETVAKNTDGKITLTGGTPVTTTTINFTQEAKPFVMSDFSTLAAGDDKSLVISAGTGSGTVTGPQFSAAIVTVEKLANGGSVWNILTVNGSDDSDATHYTRTNESDKITIGDLDGLAVGDKIRVTIKVGDAPVVSQTVTVTA